MSLFQFYSYKDATEEITDARFYGRLRWKGSNNTKDLQDGSVYINNVTFDDAGTYLCVFNRVLMYPIYRFKTNTSKSFVLTVVPQSKSRREFMPLIIHIYSSFGSNLNICSFKHVESMCTPLYPQKHPCLQPSLIIHLDIKLYHVYHDKIYIIGLMLQCLCSIHITATGVY